MSPQPANQDGGLNAGQAIGSGGLTEGAVTDPGDGAGPRLTPREREVLEHAALGMSNRQIGEALHIAEQTVKNHLGSAMRKLALHDRTHAVVIAIGMD